jgi:hypothetical protein
LRNKSLLQLNQLLLEVRVGKAAEWGNGSQAQSTPCKGADKQKLQQVSLPINGTSPLSGGPINQTLRGIEAHRARTDVFP